MGQNGVLDMASDVENGIALIRLLRPADNVLTPHTRSAILRALTAAENDSGIDGVVLTGTGATFCSGLDLSEYDQTLASPTIRELTLA
ncbi:MAG: enoyl-CoA hydratase-related protein, partial [Pseudomonadota bacterium]